MKIPVETTQIATNINQKLTEAQSVLVIASTPVDMDTIGSAVVLAMWLRAQGKRADPVIAKDPKSVYPDVAQIDQIAVVDFSKFDFGPYDLIVILDSGDWNMVFGQQQEFDYSALVEQIKAKSVHVDHHNAGSIAADLGESSLRLDKHFANATAVILYLLILNTKPELITLEMAEWLYWAIVEDTLCFQLSAPLTFAAAEGLLEIGVDHYKFAELNMPLEGIKFMGWAIENTEFIPEAHAMVLAIDATKEAEVIKLFGENWIDKDLDNYYKAVVFRRAYGYDYGITLERDKDNAIKLRWRSRNYGSPIDIKQAAINAGFQAGGHYNAGGGVYVGTMEEAKQKLIAEMKLALQHKQL